MVADRSRKRRLARVARWLLAGVLASLVAVAGGAAFVIGTERGQGWLFAEIGERISAATGWRVELDGARIEGVTVLKIDSLRIADARGRWLDLRDVTLVWRPGGLVEGVLELERIEAGALSLDRLPARSREGEARGVSTAPPDWPRLLSRLRIERVELPRIVVGEAVVGHAAVLKATLGVDGTGTAGIETRFRLAALERGGVEVEGRARLSGGRTLELDARAADGVGGLVAHMLGRPDLPAIEARLEGRGPLSRWSAEFSASLSQTVTLAGRLTADLVALDRLDLSLVASPGPRFREFAGVPLREPATLEVSGAREGSDRLVSGRIAVATGATRVSASGGFGLPDRLEAVRVEGVLAGADWPGLLPRGIGFDRVEFKAALKGRLAQPVVDATMSLHGLDLDLATVAGVTCRLTSSAPDERRLELDGECAANGVRVEERLLALVGEAPRTRFKLAYDPDSGVLAANEFVVEAAAVTLAGQGRIGGLLGPTPPEFEARARFELDDVSALDSVSRLALRGRLGGSIEVRSDTESRIRGRFSVSSADLAAADPMLTALLEGDVRLEADYAWGADAGASIENLSVTTNWARLSGRGRLEASGEEGEGRFQVRIADLSRVPLAIGGAVAGDAVLDLVATRAGGSLRFELTSTHERLVLAPLRGAGLRADVAGVVTPAGDITADVSLTGRLQDQPLTASARAVFSEGRRLRVDDLRLDLAGLRLQGGLWGTVDENLWRGRVTMARQRIPPRASIQGVTLDGEAALAVDLRAREGRQDVAWRLELAEAVLRRGGWRASVARIASVGSLLDAFGEPRVKARLEVSGLATPEAVLRGLTATASGGFDGIEVAVDLDGDVGSPVAAKLGGRLAVGTGGITLELAELTADLAGLPVRLLRPTTVTAKGPAVRVEETVLAVGTGRVRLSGRFGPSSLHARIKVEDLDLAPLAKFVGAPAVTGRVGGGAELAWDGEGQRLDAAVRARELRLSDLAGAQPPAVLDARAAWDGRALTLTGELGGLSETPARFSARLPLSAGAAPPELVLDASLPLEARLDWSGDLEHVAALLPLPEHAFTGAVELSMAVTGTLHAPRLAGTARLAEGGYEHLIFGTLLRDIELTLSGDESGALALGGRGSDGAGGRFSVSGRALLGEGGLLRATTVLRLERVRVVRRDDLKATVSSELTARSDGETMALSGKIVANRVLVVLAEGLPPSVVELEVREIHGGGGLDEAKAAPLETAALLNLVVSMPNQTFVRGRGLNSEWRGELRITGTTAEPRISGALDAVRGKLTFANRDFAIDRGRIVFDGGRDIDPVLDIVIKHERADIAAEIRLLGPVSAPELILSSTPALPQDEILARIVFGRSVAKLSPVQALQLAQSVARVTGATGGRGLLGRIQEQFGIDVLTLDAGGEAGTKVGVGKYLLDNLYLGLSKGAGVDSGEVEAVIDVTPNISVRSTLGTHSEGNIGLDWKLDY